MDGPGRTLGAPARRFALAPAFLLTWNAVKRLALTLAERDDWLRLYDPRGGGLFVPTEDSPDVGAEVRIDLTITQGGPRVILKGHIVWRRAEPEGKTPPGCSIGLAPDEREKVNFLNGYVRGGLLNRRERRRLPLRLPVTYGAIDGPKQSFTRDINDDGVFVLSDAPLPEGTVVHLIVSVPSHAEPISLKGTVVHTVIPEDEDVPGMGIRFTLDPTVHASLKQLVDELEQGFMSGSLPEEIIT